MKRLILQLFLIGLAFSASAQREIAWKDANFKFTPGFLSERRWMVMMKPDTASSYSFGFTYIDEAIGFVFQQAGAFRVGDKGNYIVDHASLNRNYERIITHRYKGFSIILNLWPMAAIPTNHFNELQIKGEPDWVKGYYSYTDTLEHNYLWGCMYANAGDSYSAMPYLEKVRKVNLYYKDVEVTMASAFNRSEQYDKAIIFLNAAIANSPRNLRFYWELAHSYELKEDWETSINICKRGLFYATTDKYEPKCWLATMIGNNYLHLNNQNEANVWWAKAKGYNPDPNNGTP
jgi:tetratricopeptide (TPR) repeat protein